LVRRGDVTKPCIDDLSEPIGPQALLPHLYRNRHAPDRNKGLTGKCVARVLDDEAITWIEQHTRAKVQALLRSIDNDDLLDVAAQAPCPPQVALKGCTEFGPTARFAIAQPLRATQERSIERALPRKRWKIRRSDITIAKVHDSFVRR
jgi:hypothetical protein